METKEDDIFLAAKKIEAMIKFTPEELFAEDNVKLVPLQKLLKDDDCFKKIRIEFAEYMGSLGIEVTYDNASIGIMSYKCKISSSYISASGRVGSYLYELQGDLCDYVVWLAGEMYPEHKNGQERN